MSGLVRFLHTLMEVTLGVIMALTVFALGLAWFGCMLLVAWFGSSLGWGWGILAVVVWVIFTIAIAKTFWEES